MDRAFGELEQAFYESGGVMSQKTATDETRRPARVPLVERSSPHLAISGQFTETVRLGVPESVDLGGYYAFYVLDAPDDGDYISLDLEDAAA
jgi:hypothetical protein